MPPVWIICRAESHPRSKERPMVKSPSLCKGLEGVL
jgi:hypothetical protein